MYLSKSCKTASFTEHNIRKYFVWILFCKHMCLYRLHSSERFQTIISDSNSLQAAAMFPLGLVWPLWTARLLRFLSVTPQLRDKQCWLLDTNQKMRPFTQGPSENKVPSRTIENGLSQCVKYTRFLAHTSTEPLFLSELMNEGLWQGA